VKNFKEYLIYILFHTNPQMNRKKDMMGVDEDEETG
jgi:hypothetical protein